MSVLVLAVFAATLFLAYANGANDNFKGVATLYGSGTLGYRTALLWATVTTIGGSLAAVFFARELMTLFSGRGLIAQAHLGEPALVIAVVLAAALTVFLTARVGLPISTTHALIGGLVGAGLVADFQAFQAGTLWSGFLKPLVVAPLIPILLVGLLYPIVRWIVLATFGYFNLGHLLGGGGNAVPAPADGPAFIAANEPAGPPPTAAQAAAQSPAIAWIARLCQFAHVLSAGAVSFARGLNDTPKIVAIALTLGAASRDAGIIAIAVAMALGGLLHARKVAITMARKITPLSPGQGTFANLVTSSLVLFASGSGIPVSTTHVSVGAIFGIGITQRQANWPLLGGIVSAWVLTLPVATALSAALYVLLRAL